MSETQWQPIETAPKDGTEFLAYDSATKKYDVCTMENWRGTNDADSWWCVQVQMDGTYGPYEGDFGVNRDTITHWMPLPSPPAIRSGEQQ